MRGARDHSEAYRDRIVQQVEDDTTRVDILWKERLRDEARRMRQHGAHEGEFIVGPVDPEREGVDVVEQADQERPVEERLHPPIDNVVGQIGQVPCQHMESPDTADLFCPPRTAAIASRFGLTAGLSMDLRTGWEAHDALKLLISSTATMRERVSHSMMRRGLEWRVMSLEHTSRHRWPVPLQWSCHRKMEVGRI